MSFDEFYLLSQNIKMKDMAYAIIVPGLIHFKAKDKKAGYWLLGIRSSSYLAIGGLYIYKQNKYKGIKLSDLDDDDQIPLRTKLYSALFVAASTYLFDLIHGEARLHRKQEFIRYKYSLKFSNQNFERNSGLTPSLGVVVNF